MSRYPRISGSQKIATDYTKINQAIDQIEQDMIAAEGGNASTLQAVNNHKSSNKAHDAQAIEYSGSVSGATNVKQAVDNLKQEVTTIIASAGDGTKDTELILARGSKEILGDRLDEFDEKLYDISININDFKTTSNDWNDAFELAYAALPENGGKILIPKKMPIIRSINLHELGTKKVLIEGNSKTNNPGHALFNAVILKQGDFDGVILNHGSGMRNITVTRDEDFEDEHDGVWVAGITCFLENVFANDHGGDGFRVGAKDIDEDSVHYNCNIGRFYNIGSYNNGGWGIKVRDDFATGINTSDANACAFFAPDCRQNQSGGILFENCMDNQVYSPDCEVNYGEAGIKIGDYAGGITIYSAYTENHGANYEILLTEHSSQNMIIGYRRGGNNDGVVDLGVGNFILGKFGAKFSGHYFHNRINAKSLAIGGKDTLGYFEFRQNTANNRLEIIAAGGAGKYAKFIDDTGSPIPIEVKEITLGSRDRLNWIRVRPQSNVTTTTVPAKSTVTKTVTTTNIKLGDFVVASPLTALPSGITYNVNCEVDDSVKIVFSNVTDASITIPDIQWRFLGINATAIT